jgi:hypothetical protein
VLELRSPNGKFVAVFSDPAVQVKKPVDEVPWRKLAIRHSDGHLAEAINLRRDSPGEAMFPLVSDDAWSPDGNYLVLAIASSVNKSGEMEGIHYWFLKLETGAFASFRGEGNFATTDNFSGWAKGKPHTILMSIFNKLIEADPTDPE